MAQSITSADILKELNIKRSTFYYLLKNNLISIPTTDTGRYAWNSEVVEQLKIILSEPQETKKSIIEDTSEININYLILLLLPLRVNASALIRLLIFLPEQVRWHLLLRTKN